MAAEETPPPRHPDFRLKALSKKTEKKGVVGAGWMNPDGSVSIVLEPFVVLSGGDDLLITLFPIR